MALALVAASSAMTLQTDDFASACVRTYDDIGLDEDEEDNCCTFYRGRDYEDRALQCCHNGDSLEIALNDTIWDNQITSFKCGAAVKYELWRGNIDQVHSKVVVITGAGKINNAVLTDYNELISNIVLEPYDDVTAPAVTAFA